MGKVVSWLKDGDRWKHLLGGLVIGLYGNGWYCAIYAGLAVGAALEYKDRAHGSAWDNAGLALTVAGAALGQLLRQLIAS